MVMLHAKLNQRIIIEIGTTSSLALFLRLLLICSTRELWLSRRSRMLPLPKSRDEITLDGDCVNTLSSKELHITQSFRGGHNCLKRVSRKTHPNLFEVVEIPKKEQAASEVAIEQLAGGGRIRSKRIKVV